MPLLPLARVWRLTTDALSQAAEFKETYDFAGEVGPDVVLALLIQREELIGAMEKAAKLYRADSRAAIILREAIDAANKPWPKDFDEPSFFP